MSQQTNQAPQVRNPRNIHLTDSAAKKVAELVLEEENLQLKLRAFIRGGGCSGFEYGFTFDEKEGESDTKVQKLVTLEEQDVTVTLVVDPMSYQYLVGATIDYKEDIDGSRFVIHNPNAKTTCGCGQSFSV